VRREQLAYWFESIKALAVNLSRPAGMWLYASLIGSNCRHLKGDKGDEFSRNGLYCLCRIFFFITIAIRTT